MSIYVTALQNSGGSYGHKLFDVASAYLFAEWLGGELFAHETWNVPELEPFSVCEGLRGYEELLDVPKRSVQCNQSTWYGVDYGLAKQIHDKIRRLSEKGDALLVLSKSCRLTLMNVWNWYHKGKIDKDVYTPVLQDLRERFYRKHKGPTGRLGVADVRVACFARRAFMSHLTTRNGNTAEFYLNIIDGVRRALKDCRVRFTFFTQEENSEDLGCLQEVSGVNVTYDYDYSANMCDLVYADILIGSYSSSSTWASYFSTGVVMVPMDDKAPPPNVRWRLNMAPMIMMNHDPFPENFVAVQPDGSFDHDELCSKVAGKFGMTVV